MTVSWYYLVIVLYSSGILLTVKFPPLLLGLDHDPSVFFNDEEVAFRQDLEMTCSWEANNDFKFVQWFRDTYWLERARLWSVEINGSTPLTSKADASFSGKVDEIPGNYRQEHRIVLRDVVGSDQGNYWCIVTIDHLSWHSTSQQLHVDTGKSLLFSINLN